MGSQQRTMTPVERQSHTLLKKSSDVKHFGTSRLGRRSKVDTGCCFGICRINNRLEGGQIRSDNFDPEPNVRPRSGKSRPVCELPYSLEIR